MSEVQESQDAVHKYKAESSVRHRKVPTLKASFWTSLTYVHAYLIFLQGLQRDVVKLQRSLQQTKVESQFLRAELSKAGGPSAPAAHVLEEKIQLLKEVTYLSSLLLSLFFKL